MKSLQTQIQIAVISVTLVVVVTVALLVNSTVEHMVVKSENDRAQETLDLVLMTVRFENNTYRYYYEALMNERRRDLKNILDNSLGAVKYAYSLFTSGQMSEKDARHLALETVRQMRYGGGSGYTWIQDCARPVPTMLMHPAMPGIEGEKGTDPRFYDALDGKKNLLAEFVRKTENGPAYVSYKWPKPAPDGLTSMRPKLSYVTRFDPWGWLIGTGLYIDDIEKVCDENRQKMITATMNGLKDVRLMDSGYIHIFDGNGIILLHPHLPVGESANQILDPKTGISIYQEIINAAHTPEGRLEYMWSKPGEPGKKLFRKITYSRYFKPLDWYIAASIYEDELHAPARALTRKIILISAGLLIIATLLCGGLVRGIVRPLERLADSALRIQADGVDHFNGEALLVQGPKEVETLGQQLHQLMNSLRQEQQQLRATFNSIGDAVIATDAEGLVTRMNPVAETLTAWPLNEAIGRPLSEVFNIIHGNMRIKVGNPVEKVLNSGQVVELEDPALLVNKNGDEFHITDSGAPIRDDLGEIMGVVLVFRDVTEKYAMQEQLRQSQKMEAVGVLAGGIAHDFNNMLGGIMGAAELVASENRDPLTKEYLSVIIESTQHAAELASKLLAFSRKQPVASVPVSVHKIINNTIAILDKTIDKKIVIETDLKAKRCMVIGDPTLLQSAFLNVANNAVQAMPDGGRLIFQSRAVELDASHCAASVFDLSPGHHIEIIVRDTGHGIAPGHLSKIFEPFFTTKPQGKGTGLGLAACYGTIQQHKGAISIHSEEGKGTSVHITLPLTKAEKVPPNPALVAKKGGGTILLVDDEAVIRFTGKTILNKFGYTVIVAENGEEAVQQYQAKGDTIDLVVCDMIMPNMNGRDCFTAIKKINPQARFILVSGFTQENDTYEMEQHGLSGYIKKPFHTADFIHIVQRVLETAPVATQNPEG